MGCDLCKPPWRVGGQWCRVNRTTRYIFVSLVPIFFFPKQTDPSNIMSDTYKGQHGPVYLCQFHSWTYIHEAYRQAVTHTDNVAEVQWGECASIRSRYSINKLRECKLINFSAQLYRIHLHRHTDMYSHTSTHSHHRKPFSNPPFPPAPTPTLPNVHKACLKSNYRSPQDKPHTFHWNLRGFHPSSTLFSFFFFFTPPSDKPSLTFLHTTSTLCTFRM